MESEREALSLLILQSNREIAALEEECNVLMELVIRKRFRNVAECRPVFARDRRKKKEDGAPAKKPKLALPELGAKAATAALDRSNISTAAEDEDEEEDDNDEILEEGEDGVDEEDS